MTPSTPDEGKRNITFAELCPSEWGFSEGACSIRLSCYRILLAQEDSLRSANLIPVDFLDFRVVALIGTIPYNYAGEIQIRSPNELGQLHMELVGSEDRTTPWGAYLLLMARSPIIGADEYALSINEDAIVGMIRLRLGRNAAFDRVFTNIIMANGHKSAFSAMFENPSWHGPPTLSFERLSELANQASRLVDATARNRLVLALRWVKRADELIGIDAFLSLWIALEILIMDGATNVSIINRQLSRVYQLPQQAITERFLVGRLFGLRARIVHGGELRGIHAIVLSYMRALLTDFVNDALAATPQHRAARLLDSAPGEAELLEALNLPARTHQ